MNTPPEDDMERTEDRSPGSTGFRLLVAVVIILAGVLAYGLYDRHLMRAELTAQLELANGKLSQLEARAAGLEASQADLQTHLDVTAEKLGVTEKELAEARKISWRSRKEQKKVAAQLKADLEKQNSQLGSLSTEVGDVINNVVENRESLDSTAMKLEQSLGDLGIQSGLIARNRQELEELKRRGEREYYEIDLHKSKRYTRVGMISVRLNKTDTKRQRFTLTLFDQDKRIEKKDKTLLEPVQFYLQGTRNLLELVIFQIDKGRVVGYLSTPKEMVARYE
jgi:chromosome segregation ATPase